MMGWSRGLGMATLTPPLVTWCSTGQYKQSESSIRKTVTGSPRRSYCVKAKVSTKESTPEYKTSEKVEKAKEGAVWGMLIGDAIGMPAHWFYKPSDIKTYYDGWLTGYEAPGKHPSSIICITPDDEMQNKGWCSEGKPVSVIGDLMLQDKVKFWLERDSSLHYHHGMKAGDNTMNSTLALYLLSTMDSLDPGHVKDSKDLQEEVLQHYLQFLITPNQHKDTYVHYCHRAFVKDWASLPDKIESPKELGKFCSSRISKNTKMNKVELLDIGALTMAIPWIVWNAYKSVDECSCQTLAFIGCTHPVKGLKIYVDAYARLLHGVLNGKDLKKGVLEIASGLQFEGVSKRERILMLLEKAQSLPKGSEERLHMYQNSLQKLWSHPMIDGAITSMLLLAYEFANDLEGGVLTNANCGGDTCNRGAPLGALLGAQAMNKKKQIPVNLKNNLIAKEDVMEWIATHQR